MNISATTTSLSQVSQVSSVSATSALNQILSTTPDSTTAPGESSGGNDQTHLSKMGALFSKLQDLETSDPAKAKQVLTSIASALTDKAKASGNTDPHLQELADKFTQAAKTSDLSALRPPGGGHHHHHHEGAPPSAPPADASGSSSAATTSTTSTDATTAGAASKAASYSQTRTDQVALESIISNALSGVAA